MKNAGNSCTRAITQEVPPTAIEDLQVTKSVRILQENTERLLTVIDGLFNRLSPILFESQEPNCKGEVLKAKSLCRHSEQLDEISTGIFRATESIITLINRLQI